jgi:hypothetical protein
MEKASLITGRLFAFTNTLGWFQVNSFKLQKANYT